MLCTFSSDRFLASFPIFYMRETPTSVTESFKIDTMGGKTYSRVSASDKYPERSQMACAIEPLTCWLESFAIYSFRIGRILSIKTSLEQNLATIGILAIASDLTSGSPSLSKSS